VTNYVKAVDMIDDATKQEILDYVNATISDDPIDDALKCRYIVQSLVDNDCRQCVKSLVRRSKEIK
jgi:hypothetical protein